MRKEFSLTNIIKELESVEDVEVAHSFKAARKALRLVRGDRRVDTSALKHWIDQTKRDQERRYGSHLYSENHNQIFYQKIQPPIQTILK